MRYERVMPSVKKRGTKRETRPVAKVAARRSSRERAPGHAAPYAAYAVSADGSRHAIDARRIIVSLGHAELEIDLVVAHPILAGRLGVSTRGGLLTLGPGDAGSVYLAVQPFSSAG